LIIKILIIRRGGLAGAFYPTLLFWADPDKEHRGKLGEKGRRYKHTKQYESKIRK